MKTLIGSMILLFVMVWGCSDDSTGPAEGNGTIKMYMTDSPAAYDSVIVIVQRVEVHRTGADSTEGWIVIDDNLRAFDLLQLRNGTTVILGDSVLPAGTYNQIRLVLANGSYVIDNGVKHDLNVPSGMQSGIKINHSFTIQSNSVYEVMIDFNVELSIHITGNNQYILRPVLRCIPLSSSGSVSGQVLPLDAQAIIFTTSGTDTISTYADLLGFFKLMALTQGTYDIEINALNPIYRDTVITGVNVTAKQNTEIGLVVLGTN